MRWSSRRVVVVGAVGLFVLFAVAVAASAVLSVPVSGVSMQPTLHSHDRVLLRPGSAAERPSRFDLVVTRFAAGAAPVVKRVVGLPGDRVEVARDAAGQVEVLVEPGGTGGWRPVHNPAWVGRWGPAPGDCCGPTGRTTTSATGRLVPAGMLFLLGDNPAESEDSRTFGWAPIALVDGVVMWRVYPLGSLGSVGGGVTLGAARWRQRRTG